MQRTVITTLVLMSAACVGTSTGNPLAPDKLPPNETGTANGGRCDDHRRDLASLDEQSPLGFSANAVLALAASAGDIQLEWPSQTSMLQFGPESGKSTLNVTLTPRASKPRFNDRSEKTAGGGAEIATIGTDGEPCPDQIEIDVNVALKTSGGAFDEVFDATLIAGNERFARIYEQIKADKLRGAFEASFGSNPGSSQLESVQFTLGFSQLGSTGSLGIAFIVGDPKAPNSAATQLQLLQWPARNSCWNGVESTLDRKLGALDARAGIALINRPGLQLMASPGRIPLALTFSAASDKLCIEGLEGGKNGASMVVRGNLHVQTADKQIDGTWPSTLTLESNGNGELSQAKLSYDPMSGIVGLLVGADVFESSFGVHGVSLGDHTQGAAFINLKRPVQAAASGTLEIWGAGPSRCTIMQPTPPSDPAAAQTAPGCPGIDLAPLLTLQINE